MADDIHVRIGGHAEPRLGAGLPPLRRGEAAVHGGDHDVQPGEQVLRHIDASLHIHHVGFHPCQDPHAADFRRKDFQAFKMPQVGRILEADAVIGDGEGSQPRPRRPPPASSVTVL